MRKKNKLYAGFISGNYEYAVWAPNRRALLLIVSMLPFRTAGAFLDQSKNKNLIELVPDQKMIYRTALDTDEPNWQAWKAIPNQTWRAI